MGIYVIPFLEVGKHLINVCLLTFGLHLGCTAGSPDHRVCSHKDFQLGIWENCRAYIPAVHYYTSVFAAYAQKPVHIVPDLGNRRYGTDFAGYTQGTNLLFNATPGNASAALLIEMHIQTLQVPLQGCRVYVPFR